MENIISPQQEILNGNEKRDIQLSVALHSLVNFTDINCKNSNNEYKYKEKTVSEILEQEKIRLSNLKSGVKKQNNESDEPINKHKEDLEYLPKEIAHTEFIVNKLNLGNLILMDSSFMHKNDEKFKKLEMNDGIRVYIFCDEQTKSLYVVSKGTAPGEFSVLFDMIFPSDSEKNTMTINREKKADLIDINDNDKTEKITTESKNEDELRKFAIGKQNIIFNDIVSQLLKPYMDENGDFENKWKNIYLIGHSSGGNRIMNLFANHILNCQDPNKELQRCKSICINSIGWARETKNYFEGQFKEKNIDFKKFADRVIDVKGSTDPISVMNENPIGKTVFMKSKGHYTEDINIDKFVNLPDRKYYMSALFFIYIKNYLSGIKNLAKREERIKTTLKAIDYWGCGKLINVLGEDVTNYRTKVFIIVLWVLFKNYVKAWFVVYIFRRQPPIEINSDEKNQFRVPIKAENSFIDNINIKAELKETQPPLMTAVYQIKT